MRSLQGARRAGSSGLVLPNQRGSNMFSRSGRALALALGFVCLPSWAQVTVPDEYAKTIAHHSDIGTLTDDFAGDSIDLSTGRLEIVQTDVDLPGSNALLVRVERRFEVADANSGGHFGM